MSGCELVIGPYNASSHSLAAWLALQAAGLRFETRRVDTADPEAAHRIEELSPNGQLPVLRTGDVPVAWELWGILEFAAEHAPALWPADPEERARARSIAAEAVGCSELGTFLPMDFVGRFEGPPRLLRAVERQVGRILAIWEECLARPDRDGPFLFGPFGLADAVMVPLAARFRTYGLPLEAPARSYADALLSLDAVRFWEQCALAEREGAQPGAGVASGRLETVGAPTGRPAPRPAEASPNRPGPPAPRAPARRPTVAPSLGPILSPRPQATDGRPEAGGAATPEAAGPERVPSPPSPRAPAPPPAVATDARPRGERGSDEAPAPVPEAAATAPAERRPLFGRGALFRNRRAAAEATELSGQPTEREPTPPPSSPPGAPRPETLRPVDPAGAAGRIPERAPVVKPIGIAARRRR